MSNLPSFVTVGRGTYWADLACHRWGNETISIGSYCSIALQTKLLAGGGHRRDTVSTFPFDVLMRGAKTANAEDRCYEHGNGLEIGSDVHLGFGCTVMGHVKVGHGAVIAANATVFTDIPPYAIAVGNPARVTKYRFDEATINMLLRVAWWDWPEERIRASIDEFYSNATEFAQKYDPAWKREFAFEREQTLQDGVTKLHIVLEVVKQGAVEAESLRPSEAAQTKDSGFAFSIIHTSARPNEWRKVYDAWLASAVNPEQIEYVLCVDRRWGFNGESEITNQLRPQDKVIWNTGRRCYVDGVNLAAAASSGDVLIVNADDQYPCDKWDEELPHPKAIVLDGKSVTGEYVVEVSTNTPTEHERSIIVMPILSRERYERFGWVFYPEYESMYADNDFAQMAKRDKCIIDARHLIFPHKHWLNQQREKDEQDRAQNSEQAYNEGAKLFAARKRIGFAGIPPKVEAPTQAVDAKKPMIAFITPGSVFPAPFLAAWTNLWGRLISENRYNVTHLVGYTSNAGMVRTALARMVMTTDYGVPVDYVMWLDDDNTITPEQFEMLMQDLREHPEYDMVCGWTWCAKDDDPEIGRATISCGALVDLEKTADGQDVKFTKIKQLTPRDIYEAPADLIEIGYSGFPAVLMRAELLKKAGKELFNPYVDPRCEYGFSGEDVAFFARATIKSGARYAVDRRVKVPHYKRRAVEPVPTQEQIEEAQKITAQLSAKY